MDNFTIKFFTLGKANSLISEVDKSLEKIETGRKKLSKNLIYAAKLKINSGKNGNRMSLKEKISDILKIQESLNEEHNSLLKKGIIIRNIEKKIVDFPTIINGDIGFFVWKTGDISVRNWHSVDSWDVKPITGNMDILGISQDNDSH